MPTPSRWMIRASFVYLTLGFILGALLLVHKAYPLHPAIWVLMPIHIELMIFGWIIQLTLGTAYWILPRYLEGQPRGNIKLSAVMVCMLNAGIVLNVFSFLNFLPQNATLAGRLLELGAVILFILLHWNRVASYRT